ncbi:MAG: S1C family serine protease [Myxococcaceae bacterium]
MTRHVTWALYALAATSCTAMSSPSSAAAPVVFNPVAARGELLSRREVVRHILPRTVRVQVFDGKALKSTASGVVVGSETTPQGTVSYVLTNQHVLDVGDFEAPRFQVLVDSQGETLEFRAESVARGKVPEMDLALVKVHGVGLSPAELATDDELEPGDDVVVVGAPYGRALSVSGGMVSQVERDPKSRTPTMLKTDAAIGYGASGGGVFSRTTGRLLAIVEGYRTAKVGFAVAEKDFSFDVPMPGETFAAPSAKLRAFLEKSGYGRFLAPVGSAGESGKRAALR